LHEPGPLILLSAVIGFIGTVLYSVALIFLNYVYLPRHLPAAARPGQVNFFFLCIAYLLTITKVI
jgi:vacuolar-type H+-ATPase subunit I/STV1